MLKHEWLGQSFLYAIDPKHGLYWYTTVGINPDAAKPVLAVCNDTMEPDLEIEYKLEADLVAERVRRARMKISDERRVRKPKNGKKSAAAQSINQRHCGFQPAVSLSERATAVRNDLKKDIALKLLNDWFGKTFLFSHKNTGLWWYTVVGLDTEHPRPVLAVCHDERNTSNRYYVYHFSLADVNKAVAKTVSQETNGLWRFLPKGEEIVPVIQ